MKKVEEHVAFDGFSLVAELGGVFGLFLGWSFYPMIMALVSRYLAKAKLEKGLIKAKIVHA